MASSLLGGIINAFILDLPLKTGLAMASGLAGIRSPGSC
jgi:uncharacterized membrane protein YbjE (DUF340 family)